MNENDLLIQYEPLVHYVWNKEVFKNKTVLFWKEDILQEGRIGLLSAIRGYKEDSNASFDTYAYRAVRRCMLNSIERQFNNRYGIFNPKSTSFDNPCGNTELTILDSLVSNIGNPEKELELKDLKRISINVIQSLSLNQQKVINRIIRGESQAEIARKLNMSRQAVNDCWSKFSKKCKNYLRNEDHNLRDFPLENMYRNREYFIEDLKRYYMKDKGPYKKTPRIFKPTEEWLKY